MLKPAKKYVGRAFVNPVSKIVARIYSRSKEGVDEGFFRQRIRQSLQARSDCLTKSARLVFAEADFLPGLIIDQFVGWQYSDIQNITGDDEITFDLLKIKFGEPKKWLSIQFLSFAMDCRKNEIINAVENVLAYECPEIELDGIVEKSAPVREREGLPLFEGVIKGQFPKYGIVIFEGNCMFHIDLLNAQKTGHFLDQKENHRRAAKYAFELSNQLGKKLKVLDAFCYTGGFTIPIARICDAEITASDSSEAALAALHDNLKLNGVQNSVTAVTDNVFDLLTKYERAKMSFDLVILDPPAFAKSRSSMDGAVRGYKEINLRALKLLSNNGILITCSCSYAMTEEKFKTIIADAAFDAGVRLVQLDFCYQSNDHPILVSYEESQYLKCAYYRVLKLKSQHLKHANER
ncbi:MAG: class I SAM-dependent rRNA methyltransferase [Termitinemataceae bacterium]|nr:MAG: class I SAM-dependent rRNA methyltransferase [Termitinemataceae bacterium]